MRKLVLTATRAAKYDNYPGEALRLQAEQRLSRRWRQPAPESLASTWQNRGPR
jgi:hypothetical protein